VWLWEKGCGSVSVALWVREGEVVWVRDVAVCVREKGCGSGLGMWLWEKGCGSGLGTWLCVGEAVGEGVWLCECGSVG
jgi:hypothetical protein